MSDRPGNETEPEQQDAFQNLQTNFSQLTVQMEKIVAQQAETQKLMQTILLRQVESEGRIRELNTKVDRVFPEMQQTLSQKEQKQSEKRMDEISTNFTPLSTAQTSAQNPVIYLEFDKGWVEIELDYVDCPKISELFLKIIRKQPIKEAKEVVELSVGSNSYSNLLLTCNHSIKFDVSGDQQKAKDKRCTWGLRQRVEKRYPLIEDFELCPEFNLRGYFGRVVKGDEILVEGPDQANRLKLLDHGVIE